MTISRATPGVATPLVHPFGTRIRTAAVVSIALAALAAGGIADGDRAVAAGSSITSVAPDAVPFYVVQPSVNGEPEFLFAIAQRFLGDGNRFEEIFALNEGRPQPDGSAMTVATSLNPGWILQLPGDAQGDGLQFGPIAGAVPSNVEISTPIPTPQPELPVTPPVEEAGPVAEAPAEEPQTESAAFPVGLLVAALFALAALGAAGAYLWLRKRKSPLSTSRPNAVANDGSSSWTIDSALKIVTAACDREQIAFPGLYLVTVDATSIHLLLSTPSAKPPEGWTASSDGRTWSATLAYLQTQSVPAESNGQFSGLATLGTTDTGRVLLDFDMARGAVTVEGAAAAVSDVVESWLTQLTGSPWSGSPQVARLFAHGTAQQEGIDDFLARVDQAEHGIAVVEETPTRAQGEAIRALYSSPDFRWIVIVKGGLASASWKFAVRDGLLTSGFLPDIHHNASAGSRPAATVAAS